jgi:hypothetical protein
LIAASRRPSVAIATAARSQSRVSVIAPDCSGALVAVRG